MNKPAQTVASIAGDWDIFEGSAFGCRTPVMRGAIIIKAPPRVLFSLIDKAFEERFKEKLAKRITSSGRPDEEMLHRLLQWSLMIQRLKKIPVSQEYHVLSTMRPGTPTPIALPFVHARATSLAVKALCHVLPALVRAEKSARRLAEIMQKLDTDLSDALGPLSEPGQNRTFLTQIARERGVPINTANRFHPVFGSGCHAIRLESTLTAREANLAMKIAGDKHLTGRLLRQAGLPGADNMLVQSLDQALDVAKRLEYPVVVKPSDEERGRGVYADIRSDEALTWAYENAAKVSSNLLVEKHFEGSGHRISLFGDTLLSATRKIPAGVTGDGQNTIRDLVETKRRERDSEHNAQIAYHQPLELDDEALWILNERNLSPETVLPEGKFLALRRKNNAIAGGETETLEVADVHPDNLQLCKDAAAAIGLELAGVDLLIPDISVSWEKSGALICELNAKPQVGYSAAEQLIDALFPDGGHVAVHVVLASDPDAIDQQAFLALGEQLGCDVVADKHGLFVKGERKPRRFERSFDAMRSAIFSSGGTSLLCTLSVVEGLKLGLPIGHVDTIFALAPTSPTEAQTNQMKKVLKMLKPNCGKIISLPQSLEIEG